MNALTCCYVNCSLLVDVQNTETTQLKGLKSRLDGQDIVRNMRHDLIEELRRRRTWKKTERRIKQ